MNVHQTLLTEILTRRNFLQEEKCKALPGKVLMLNYSPSYNWKRYLGDGGIALFQAKVGNMGYKFQLVTLEGFPSLNISMFELAKAYGMKGKTAYARLQEREFELEREGYQAVKHRSFVGGGYFGQLHLAVSGGEASTTALKGCNRRAEFS